MWAGSFANAKNSFRWKRRHRDSPTAPGKAWERHFGKLGMMTSSPSPENRSARESERGSNNISEHIRHLPEGYGSNRVGIE
ncbi:hypothetical protein R1flu_013891 [Riccia fluitans]|uniref:Uncharacterized protein n=1 Tax=Riccia fluitans TaxID=41844 RepID=A0ABD1YEW0_9MARC